MSKVIISISKSDDKVKAVEDHIRKLNRRLTILGIEVDEKKSHVKALESQLKDLKKGHTQGKINKRPGGGGSYYLYDYAKYGNTPMSERKGPGDSK